MTFMHPHHGGLVVSKLSEGITSERDKGSLGVSTGLLRKSVPCKHDNLGICANGVKEDQMVPEDDSLGMTQPHQPAGFTPRGKDSTSKQAQDFFLSLAVPA